MTASPLLFQGEQLLLDPAGVLVWPRLGLLAVADLHLEKGSACARQGRLVPPWDTRVTLDRFVQVVRAYRPRIIVAVGDSFHDAQAAERLGRPESLLLAELSQGARVVWVCGNHDPSPPSGIDGECVAAFHAEGLVFRHQAQVQGQGEVSGHFHPKARVATRAGEIVRPCFLVDSRRIMLPSFGAYTGGLDLNSPAIAELYPEGGEAFLLGREKLFRFALPASGARALAAGAAVHRFA